MARLVPMPRNDDVRWHAAPDIGIERLPYAGEVKWNFDPPRVQMNERVRQQVPIVDDIMDEPNVFPQFLAKDMKMNKPTIGAYLGIDVPGTFGIEVEVEGENLLKAISGKWIDKADGSLRGEAREYILRKPLSLEKAKESILDLKKALSAKGSILTFSFRTSVHIHVNVLKMNKHQLHCFLYLAHLFEHALVNYSGKDRTGNRFCLRCSDAEQKVEAMYYFLEKERLTRLTEDALKYSAINIVPVLTQGSVEFRSMRGTLDLDVLGPWLDVLQNIYNVSLETTATELAKEVLQSPEKLIKKVFMDYLPLFQYPTLEQDLKKNFSMLIEMPYLEVKD